MPTSVRRYRIRKYMLNCKEKNLQSVGIKSLTGNKSGFKNEIGVILINHGKEDFTVEPGMRIAQAVLNKFETIDWKEVTELSGYNRGGGFGHSGLK